MILPDNNAAGAVTARSLVCVMAVISYTRARVGVCKKPANHYLCSEHCFFPVLLGNQQYHPRISSTAKGGSYKVEGAVYPDYKIRVLTYAILVDWFFSAVCKKTPKYKTV